MEIGKPGKRLHKCCGCRVYPKLTKRGMRFVVEDPNTKMVRFISKDDYNKASSEVNVCAYLPEPFAKR